MHLIIGGAYSGKKAYVKSRWPHAAWITAYSGNHLLDWKKIDDGPLVLEGFEQWIGTEDLTDLKAVRTQYSELLNELLERKQETIIIMLEIGKGIVPVSENERRLRDVNGWIQQDAAAICTDVHSVWHGLVKKVK
ncbi:bifunctional adenosylcobinamide kinase/adenosylcobinamide-phosphate guanylyltransferase [Metabacillus sp. cB07]|uniref:bifunctional adenosylcobinamide kinase/adenosylcobinamide-phosphate guanylyltransferase n=1 Tax=Metabacillus sp. cB07 TaxID=2806989 RepID=UPI0019395DA1|nr:bifunctional adenosylcobinamide kinase/adenosylcobinamide-phosphate guanylyltransferase [Metabacillus sp. cB07]